MRNSQSFLYKLSIILNLILGSIIILLGFTTIVKFYCAKCPPREIKWDYRDNSQWHDYTSLFDSYLQKQADIVFVGDSITSRCHFNEFFVDHIVANRGIGSDTTEGLLNRLESITSLQPHTIVIMIGINDIAKSIAVEDACSNMEEILTDLTTSLPEAQILLFSVLPAVNEDCSEIQKLNNGYQTIAKRFDHCEFVDIYPNYIINDAIDKTLFSPDGVHLNGTGYLVWMDVLSTHLK